MKLYYINNDQTRNPGLHHEVHTSEHAAELRISSKKLVGYYDKCQTEEEIIEMIKTGK